MTTPVGRRTVVIAVGNPWASDDGVGHHVATRARPRLGAHVRVVATHGEPARLVEAWADADVAVVVDAVAGRGRPGDVVVLDAATVEHEPERRAHGSHALGVAEAVRLGRVLGRLPATLVCVGIEGSAWGPGDQLSAEVAAALDEAADAVVRAVDDAVDEAADAVVRAVDDAVDDSADQNTV